MSIVAGIYTNVLCKHSVAGNYNFDLKSGEDSELDTGGLRIVDDENNRTVSGQMILQYENKMPYLQITCATDKSLEEYVKALIENSMTELGTWTLTHISGDVYIGKGTIIGDVRPNRNAGTIQLKIGFEGEILNL